jgi:hypothetical protein
MCVDTIFVCGRNAGIERVGDALIRAGAEGPSLHRGILCLQRAAATMRKHAVSGAAALHRRARTMCAFDRLRCCVLQGLDEIGAKDSALTHVLEDALGGNCVTSVVCVVAENDAADVALRTLELGENLRGGVTYPIVGGFSWRVRAAQCCTALCWHPCRKW